MGEALRITGVGTSDEDPTFYQDEWSWPCLYTSEGWWSDEGKGVEATVSSAAPGEPSAVQSFSESEFAPTEESKTEAAGKSSPRGKRALSLKNKQEGPPMKSVKLKASELSTMRKELTKIKNSVNSLLCSFQRMENMALQQNKKKGKLSKKQDNKTVKKTEASGKKNSEEGKSHNGKRSPASKRVHGGLAAQSSKKKGHHQAKQKEGGKTEEKGEALPSMESKREKPKKQKPRKTTRKAKEGNGGSQGSTNQVA
ncbi:uncharacterized protein [Notamacropus eugenii]|uniref:uncharacterized protein n=1 Tax=Notamacropus eugenii TaxID=9315 RepID=UPI003B685CC9